MAVFLKRGCNFSGYFKVGAADVSSLTGSFPDAVERDGYRRCGEVY
jgi:hypothetical protein